MKSQPQNPEFRNIPEFFTNAHLHSIARAFSAHTYKAGTLIKAKATIHASSHITQGSYRQVCVKFKY